MPQQVSRTKCITGSNIGWECMQDILFDRPDVRPQIKQFSDVPACLPDEVFCISGVNALSEYSMLNKEKNDTYAIAKEEARRLQIRTDKEYGETRIEIWRYNPCFFSKNGIVDKLSLFLAMKDMDDERIQIELETMINNMIW